MRKNFIKKFLVVGLSTFISFSNVIYANEGTSKFFINGRERADAEIVLKSNTTYVPLRIVSEELGAQVIYDNTAKHIVVNKEGTSLEMSIGEKEALLNGEKLVLSNEILLHTTTAGKQLAYVPLRSIFEIFDGAVDYNKEYQYVNAYNKGHVAYNALEGLKSEDLTTYRFAQLALPRIGEENMSINGGRVVEYIFPLNKKSNYFFIRIDPSGDMDITSIAYMEIENSVAICKWYKELRGDVHENINPLNNAINRSLGARGITMEIGEFPNLKETSFIKFTRHSMIQPSPEDDYIYMYKETFEDMIGVLTPQGGVSLPQYLIEETLWSPYAYKYKMRNSGGTEYYQYWANDTLLSRIDEEKVMIK